MDDNELETWILIFKSQGMPDSQIIQGLEHSFLGGKGTAREEINRAFQRLRSYGFIDNNGLITEKGINTI